jgi:hypothetical protein
MGYHKAEDIADVKHATVPSGEQCDLFQHSNEGQCHKLRNSYLRKDCGGGCGQDAETEPRSAQFNPGANKSVLASRSASTEIACVGLVGHHPLVARCGCSQAQVSPLWMAGRVLQAWLGHGPTSSSR